MAEPTLLQQARKQLDRWRAGTRPWDGLQALDCILQYLEQRHAAASGPALVAGRSYAECEHGLFDVAGPCPTCQLRGSGPIRELSAGDAAEQVELSKLYGQFPSFDLDLERTRQGTTAPADTLDLDELQRLCDVATTESHYGRLALFAVPKLIARVRELQARAQNADALREYADQRAFILAKRVSERVCMLCHAKRKGTHCADCHGELRQDSDGGWYVPLEGEPHA